MDEAIPQIDGLVEVDRGPVSRPETPRYQQKMVRYCLDLYRKFKESAYREKTISEIEDSHKAYNQEAEETSFPFEGASNDPLPLDTITVDNVEPRLVAALIGKEPIVRFEMDGMEKKDEATEILEDWFNKELKNKVKIKPVTINIVHQLLLEGTVYAVPEYSVVNKKRKEFLVDQRTGLPMLDETQNRVVVETEQTVYDGGKIDIIPFSDVFVADNIGTIEEWEEAEKIRLVRPTYAELQEEKDKIGYQNIGPFLLTEKTDRVEQSPGQVVSGADVTGKEVIECLECHISYPIYQDQEKEEDQQTDFRQERIIVTIAIQSETVVRMLKQSDKIMDNSCLIKRIRIFPEMQKSYGKPIHGKFKSIQKGGTELFNMLINIAYLTMMPWFFYDKRSGLRGEITLRPGQGVPVDDVNGIKIPEFRINPSQYLEFVNIFMSLWEKLGNISDTQIGRVKDSNATATEIMTVVQEGNVKHNYQSEQMVTEYLSVLQTLYDLYYQQMDPNKSVKYGSKMVPFPFAVMRRNYRFALTGSTEAANKYIDRREKEDLMKVLGGDPYIVPTKPREELLKAYGVRELEQWINPQVKMLVDASQQNPEIVRVVQQYMQDKAAIQQQMGAINGNAGAVPSGGVSGVPAA